MQSHIKDNPDVIITYFVQDSKKSYGGQYLTKKTKVKRMDDIYQTIVCEDGTVIQFKDITEIAIL